MCFYMIATNISLHLLYIGFLEWGGRTRLTFEQHTKFWNWFAFVHVLLMCFAIPFAILMNGDDMNEFM